MIDQIIEEYYPRVYAFALVHVKSEVLAEDLTQDVFLQLIKRQSRLAEIDHMESYIFTMVRNAVYREYRRMQHNLELKAEMVRNIPESHPAIDEQIESRELNRNMDKIVNQLPDRQREIYHLSRDKGLSHKEIAEKLNISPNTVKNHLVQALKTMRAGYKILKAWMALVVFWVI